MELFSEIVTLDKLFNATAFCSIVRKEIGHFHLLDLKFWEISGKSKKKGIIGARDLQQVNVKHGSAQQGEREIWISMEFDSKGIQALPQKCSRCKFGLSGI